MSDVQITKAGKRRKRLRQAGILLKLLVLLILAGGIYIGAKQYKALKIEVEGNTTYTAGEIEAAILADDYVPNTLVMTVQNRLFHLPYLPFIERMEMSIKSPHVLKVSVREKERPGVFSYMKKYFYFDENGIVQETRNTLFEDVPVVSGVKFREVKLEERIQTEGDYVNTIIAIVRDIRNYKLDVSEIRFDGAKNVILVSGNYQIDLGTGDYLEDKMARVGSILSSVSGKYKEGIIDMHRYTDEKKYITFREADN